MIGAVGDDVCGAGRPPTGRGKGMTAALLDLALPLECAGCGARGSAWCAECDGALRGAPVPVRPRVPPGVPVWSAGTFVGARRGAVIAVKEQGRRDAVPPLAGAVRRLVLQLREAGEIDPPELSPVILVPAPSRASAARRRGGDPVWRIARRAARTLASSAPPGTPPDSAARMLRLRAGVRDSVGLGAGQRQRNLDGRVGVLRGVAARAAGPAGEGPHPRTGGDVRLPTVVLVDDVITTGATVSESVRALAGAGITVRAALTLGHA